MHTVGTARQQVANMEVKPGSSQLRAHTSNHKHKLVRGGCERQKALNFQAYPQGCTFPSKATPPSPPQPVPPSEDQVFL